MAPDSLSMDVPQVGVESHGGRLEPDVRFRYVRFAKPIFGSLRRGAPASRQPTESHQAPHLPPEAVAASQRPAPRQSTQSHQVLRQVDKEECDREKLVQMNVIEIETS